MQASDRARVRRKTDILRSNVRRPMRVLVVDDEPEIYQLLSEPLTSWGYEVKTADSGEEALNYLRAGHLVDVVLTDLTMPGMMGTELLQQVKAFNHDIEVIVMTGFGSIPSAVDAMRLGAHNYITKPINFSELEILLGRMDRAQRLTNELETLRLEVHEKYADGGGAAIVGSSLAMRRVIRTIHKISTNKISVLIQGASGTGKELVARAIHYGGVTAKGPFLAVNCGSVSCSLLKSQLFGHVKGSFTNAYRDEKGYFRAADGGTLLLDEITEMDPAVQVELLRVLQEREVTPVGATAPISVDVRIIAATNQPLDESLASGRLRRDLYYRLNVVTIKLPLLRERPADLPELVQYFNIRFSETFGVAPKKIPRETLDRLKQYHWPGNVRELENVMARAFALAEDEVRLPDDFAAADSQLVRVSPPPTDGERPSEADGLPTLMEAERELLAASMKCSGGIKSVAAKMLGIEPRRFSRMLKKLGLAAT